MVVAGDGAASCKAVSPNSSVAEVGDALVVTARKPGKAAIRLRCAKGVVNANEVSDRFSALPRADSLRAGSAVVGGRCRGSP
jgi:hypothetical protein